MNRLAEAAASFELRGEIFGLLCLQSLGVMWIGVSVDAVFQLLL